MKLFRKILFPFAVLYGWIVQFRNFLYDIGLFQSYRFDISIIAVGNLSVGGTGKTPQIEYLIRLLGNNFKIATLSRGYKRHSKGFILADKNATAVSIGDEPFQFYQKFPNIHVAVDADRKNGIEKLLALKQKPEIILLDDAFQHRRVKAGLYILLTAYNDLFCDDFMLPTGNLRESRSGAKRANIIVVTKCPVTISDNEMKRIKKKIALDIPVFFSSIAYDEKVYSATEEKNIDLVRQESKLIIAGIAKPKPFFNFIKNDSDEILTFPDHHHFTDADILEIKNKAQNKLIVTTEKDYVRLKESFSSNQLFYLPIKTAFINDSVNFDEIIKNYVGKSSGNS